jgi:hypothetical protein
MRKFLTTALAAITAAGAVLATAAPAEAQRYRHHRHHNNNDGDEVAAAILGGVAGLALGAAIAGNGSRGDRGYYSGYAYDPRYDSYRGGYYHDGYYRDGRRAYDYGDRRYTYRTCISRDRVYDPYIGRRVTIERRYAC